MAFLETSALDSSNVVAAFDCIIRSKSECFCQTTLALCGPLTPLIEIEIYERQKSVQELRRSELPEQSGPTMRASEHGGARLSESALGTSYKLDRVKTTAGAEGPDQNSNNRK